MERKIDEYAVQNILYTHDFFNSMKIFTNCLFRLPGPSKDVKPVIKKEPTSATSTFKPKLENKKPSPKKVSPSKTNIKKGII